MPRNSSAIMTAADKKAVVKELKAEIKSLVAEVNARIRLNNKDEKELAKLQAKLNKLDPPKNPPTPGFAGDPA